MLMYFNSLKIKLKEIGIEDGDVLYVASDIKTLLFYGNEKGCFNDKITQDKFINSFIDSIISAIGSKGTVLFPAFSWEFCRGNGFNIHYTKSEVGSLSNWIIKNRNDFIRTRHPLYSFMVYGRFAKEFVEMDYQDAWGEASLFRYFHENNSKQLLFNIESYQGLTFAHYVEQCINIPYRHPKYFFGKYVDEKGKEEIRCYSMYVRDINVDSLCGIHNEFLIDNGVAKQTNWNKNVLTVVELGKSFEIIKNDMICNNGKNTLIFNNYVLDWTSKRTIKYEIGGLVDE